MTHHPSGAEIENNIDPLAKPYNVGDYRDSFWMFNYFSEILSAQQKTPTPGKRPFPISGANPYATIRSNQSGNEYHPALSIIGTLIHIRGVYITVVFWPKKNQRLWNCYHRYFMHRFHGLFFIQFIQMYSGKANDSDGIRQPSCSCPGAQSAYAGWLSCLS
jgi:hypothetical protein